MSKPIRIIQYGLGNVGQALLGQVLAGRGQLAGRMGLELRYVGLMDRSGLLLEGQGLSDAALRAALEGKVRGEGLARQPGSRPRPPGPVVPANRGRVIVVDVTAAEGMEAVAEDALERDWGVVLANKRPLAGPLETYRRLTGSRRLRFEATVGAGLPWIEALTHLLDTGDRVLRLEAAVSGTLGFVFSRLEAGVAFSAAVVEARSRGYSEPDPRDDLSAADVRRKALILARLLGLAVEWQDAPVEPLYPAEWDALAIEDFMAALPALDGAYAQRVDAARASGCVLRCVVAIEEGRLTVGLRQVSQAGPLGALAGTGCLLAVYSERYSHTPLVISGPGAGAAVTAGGVYADMIALGLQLSPDRECSVRDPIP